MIPSLLKHLLVWTIWSGASVLYMQSLSPNSDFFFWDMVVFNASLASVVYAISLWSLAKFYAQGKLFKMVGSVLIVIVVFFLFRYFHIIVLNPILAPGYNEEDPFVWESFLIQQAWFFFQHFLFGLGYFFHLDAVRKQEENQAKEIAIANGQIRENLARQAAIKAEISYLRSQFDSHFLFNSLSCFHQKAASTDLSLAESIFQLTNLMRYTLQRDPSQLVPLALEIEQTKNFIDLCQVRYNNSLQIKWATEGNEEGKYILPMVLISLVENALKHGQLRNPDDPLRIDLVINGHICIRMANKKAREKALHTNGSGNKNLQRRLELAYGTRHHLSIQEDASHYRFELTLENLESILNKSF